MSSKRTKPTDYRKYLKGIEGKRLDELAIFEIGGTGRYDGRGAPIINSLRQRRAKRVIYRDIDVRDRWCRYMSREEYRPHSTQRLREHKSPHQGIDKLILEWDGSDIPYPFPDESFDEFHSHMVTANIVRSNKIEYSSSPEIFAEEVTRMLKSGGRLYLSTDTPYFFGGSNGFLPAVGSERADLVDRLIQGLCAHGFSMNVVDSNGTLKENLQGKNYGVPIRDVNLGFLRHFSYVAGYAHVDLVLIATKAP